ncbi:hypothetical protein Hanom_Chr13g01188991 [Helianthus anomalus]
MVDAEVNQAQGFVLVGEAAIPSYTFDEIIRVVQIDDEEMKDILDDIDNFDPTNGYDEDNDQGSTGLLIVNPFVQQKIDDFMDDEINEQKEDQ